MSAGGNPALSSTLRSITRQDNREPSTVSSTASHVTVADVVVKTAIIFVALLAGAVVGWNFLGKNPVFLLVAVFVAAGCGIAVSLMKNTIPLLVLLYGVMEGAVLGGVSMWYAKTYGNDIVQQAVLGTLVAFVVTLIMYRTKLVRVTSRSRKIFLIVLISYAAIGFVSFIAALFGVGGGYGFYGVGALGILLCLAGVAIASWSLVIDYDTITRVLDASASGAGLPRNVDWKLGFGLTVSLVWVYLEILRLLGLSNR